MSDRRAALKEVHQSMHEEYHATMSQENIIRLAREAHTAMLAQGRGVSVWNDGAYVGEVQEFCERFAALVAAAEREACAKVCDGWMHANGNDCAEAIRARGEQEEPR